jgi:GT2 family glycosyltransferase
MTRSEDEVAAVSVVIPSHNRPAELPRACAVALGQRGVAVDVVVVDDGSQPPASRGLPRHPRLTILRHERPRGSAAARNAGVAASTAPWVAFLDDDDLWAPDKLSTQLAAGGDADLVYASALHVTGDGGLLGVEHAPPASELRGLLGRFNAVPAASSNVLVRRALLDREGVFDEQFSHFTDWDLWIRLARVGRLAACPEALVAYTMHEANFHSSQTSAAAGELRRFAAHHRQRGADGIDREALQRWLAGGHRRSGRHLRAAARFLTAAGIGPHRRESVRDAGRELSCAAGLRRAETVVGGPAPAWVAEARDARLAGEPV